MVKKATPLGPNFYKHTPRRAMGSETEYTVQSDSLPRLDSHPRVSPHVAYFDAQNDAWLDNGARLYYDMYYDGSALSVVEYATPECLSARDVAIHEKIGDTIVTGFAYDVAPHSPTGYPVFKRSSYTHIPNQYAETDILEATSMGHHENYSTPLTRERVLPILSYLATRPLWAGAGIVADSTYETSQKRNAIDYTSDEGIAVVHGCKTPVRFRGDRLEVRTGDGNMSPWAIRTKYAMTSLVLRLVEHNAFPKQAIIGSEALLNDAALVASADPLVRLPGLPLAGGNTVSHQATIAAAGLEFASSHDVPAEERRAANHVLGICNSFTNADSLIAVADSLADRVDWAAKLAYIRREVGIRGTKFSDVNARRLRNVQFDLLWEAMGDNAPSALHYLQAGNTIAQARLARAMHTTPNTRARVRAQLHREFGNDIHTTDWDHVHLLDGSSFRLTTPYRNYLRQSTHL